MRVLLVGCGQLGSRHLQAVAALPQVSEVEVVDAHAEALALARQRLTEVSDRAAATKYRWLSSLDEATPGGDLCIVATQAEGRRQLVEQAAERLGYKSFILEKVVTQSVAEYESLMAFSEKHALSVWVNCQTRTYPFHKHVKAKLDPSEPIIFSRIGGNLGLACNGIHAADLFAYYDDCDAIENAGSSIDPVVHPSKRGDTVFDLSGVLNGRTAKGSRMAIAFAINAAPDHISIVASKYRCVVDHVRGWAWESTADADWRWQPVAIEGQFLVSNTTKSFVADILAKGACELPTLAEAYSAHRFILGELQPYFSEFLGKELDRCPVT